MRSRGSSENSWSACSTTPSHFSGTRRPTGNGLTPDRSSNPDLSSVAAVGFALTAYSIGVEKGWITRAQAAERTLSTLRFLWLGPQGPEPQGVMGYKGFFYHFLDARTGHRAAESELSTIDTALLMAGVLEVPGLLRSAR